MPKLNAKDILIPTVALVVICAVTTALLAGTNEMTKEPIAVADEQSRRQSMEAVTPNATAEFEKIEISDSASECYAAKDADGNIIAYAVSTGAKGYGGTIKVMTGFNAEDGSIIAVNVYDNSDETPGLGAKTSDEKFSGQFSGEYTGSGFAVSKDADKMPENKTVDAVTGATISSRAAVSAVNNAVSIYNEITGGDK
ncbi:MAG: RnfABCDGE type electron transport complex subunit G [Lachnospiraceae bacterium]|nr:RnfABCDGE type electron transport complex subunit G [Lachnospiraceae bacterium]